MSSERSTSVFVPACQGAVLLALASCASNPERLPELDRRFYYALDDAKAQAEFLDVKTAERQAYLEKAGLWQQWSALSQGERDSVMQGEVKVGYHEFQAFMAWGPPADTRKQETTHRAVFFHVFIRCTSGPKTGRYVRNNLDCDGTSSETQIAVENDLVTEIKYPN
jgi:hypothetical protein